VAVLDYPPAQVVQVLGVGLGPVVRQQLAGAPVGRDQPVGHGVEVDRLERPALERERGKVEIVGELRAHVFREARLFGGVALLGQARAHRLGRSRRERQIALAQIVEGI